MAYDLGPQIITLEAADDLSAKQYYFVSIDADGKATYIATDDNQNAIGILQNTPTAGQAAAICVGGLSKLEVNAAVAEGVAVAPNFTTATTNVESGRGQTGVTGQFAGARSITAATAQGDIITVLVTYQTVALA